MKNSKELTAKYNADTVEDFIEVESTSQPGFKWTLVKRKELWECDCPGFKFNRNCKHVYNQFREENINAVCKICGSHAIDWAHMVSRAQDPKHKYEITNIRPLCRKHHDLEENNPEVRKLRQELGI